MRKKEKRRKYEFLFAALLLLGALFAVGRLVMMQKGNERSEARLTLPPNEVKLGGVRRAIDGVFVPEGQENPPLAGVMVENMEEAQPISGIDKAALVFEAVTEANITRFLAYFILDGEIEIGPVRSARPYFLDWAAEFDTLFAHVGSSPAAYNLLRKSGVDGVQDLDQWYNSQYFFRKAGRPKPHHLYITKELLSKAYEAVLTPSHSPSERGRNETISSPFEGEVRRGLSSWQFKNDASPDLRGDVREITIGYVTPYEVTWLYDKSLNVYKRVQWSGVHTTADGQEIVAKNIAVAFQDMQILDEVGRKAFTTLGQGKGLVFQDGRVVVGTWKKLAVHERLRFYDSQGNEVEFNGGTTWVEIVPKGYKAAY